MFRCLLFSMLVLTSARAQVTETYSYLHPVRDARFSRDGKSIVSVTTETEIPPRYLQAQRRDLATGKLTQILKKPVEWAHAHALSQHGEWLATADNFSTKTRKRPADVHIWSLKTGKRIASFLQLPHQVKSLSISPDGRQLLICYSGVGKKKRSLRFDVWDVNARKSRILVAECRGSFPICFSPDNRTMLLPSADKPELWDAITGKRLRKPEMDQWPAAACFSPDGKDLYLTQGRREGSYISIVHVQTGKERGRLREASPASYSSIVVDPRGKHLIAWRWHKQGHRSSTGFGRWDLSTNKSVEHAGPPSLRFQPFAFSPDGRSMLCQGGLHHRAWSIIQIVDLDELDRLTRSKIVIPPGPTKQVVGTNQITIHPLIARFTPDGKHLIAIIKWEYWQPSRFARRNSPKQDYHLQIWDLEQPEKPVFSQVLGDRSLFVPQLELSPSGESALILTRYHVQLWDLSKRRLRWQKANIFGLTSFTSPVTFSPNGSYVAIPYRTDPRRDPKPRIEVLSVKSGKTLTRIHGAYGTVGELRFSPDGRWLAAVDRHGVKVWSTKSRKIVGVFKPGFTEKELYKKKLDLIKGQRGYAIYWTESMSFVFAPDSKSIWTSSRDMIPGRTNNPAFALPGEKVISRYNWRPSVRHRRWSLPDGKEMRSIQCLKSSSWLGRFCPKRGVFLSRSIFKGTWEARDTKTLAPLKTFIGGDRVVSADGSRFAFVGKEKIHVFPVGVIPGPRK